MRSNIEIDGIGTLWHSGRSPHWTGSVTTAGQSDPIDVTFAGTVEGPTPRQSGALRAALVDLHALLDGATERLGGLLAQVGLPSEEPWASFQVTGISVPAEAYDPTGAVHVHIDLAHVEEDLDFWPALEVVDGEVRNVLSGT